MTNRYSKGWLALVLVMSAAANAADMTETEFKAQAHQKAMMLGKTLKQSLQQAVKSGGLAHGVSVCKDIAPSIAKQLSTDGWQVGRTAIKVRNTSNQPDTWEQAGLQAMLDGLSDGLKPNALTQVKIDSEAGNYRYMAPIMTGKLCLNCHGSEIKPEVKAMIDAEYPADQATGFEAGELRGAFTITYQSE